MKLNLLKCHGSGNTFLLLDEHNEKNPIIAEQQRAVISRTLCHPQSGLDADGVLFYQESTIADCAMRMFNPDGTEAEMCGNGLRCAGRYAAETLNKTKISVETGCSPLSVSQTEPLFPGITTYAADIGPVSLETGSLPMETAQNTHCNELIPELSDTLRFTALSIPNPHLIAFVPRWDTNQLQRIGQSANNTPRFPRGVNVSFVRVLDKETLFVVTYERGAGITEACGTAMSAASFCSVKYDICQAGHNITVYNQGGMVCCAVFPDEKKVCLQGNATFVSNHKVRLDHSCHKMAENTVSHIYAEEIKAYNQLKKHAKNSVVT
ncbi:MAG: diaminopimelate epimerase [Pseudomonadota bacterium]